jgi:DNA-binding protein Fis
MTLPLPKLGTAARANVQDNLDKITDHAYHLATLMTEGVDTDQYTQLNLYRHAVDALERGLLQATLRATHGNQSASANALGLNRATLRTKQKRHDLA